jgi:hypothetical protein
MGTAQAAPLLQPSCEVISLDAVAADARRRAVVRPLPTPGAAPAPLRCVSSGYLAEDRSCAASVPAEIARAAWLREQARHPHEDRLFQFVHEGEQWLGFGLADGTVRGVYCPEHNARRAEHYYHQHADPRPRLQVVRGARA